MSNTNDKNLMQVSQNTIWNKIKEFFNKLFNHTKQNTNTSITNESNSKKEDNVDIISNFNDLIKVNETEESKLLKLLRLYRSGKIKEEDLTQEEIKKLCDLYDKQIKHMEEKNKNEMEELIKLKKEN